MSSKRPERQIRWLLVTMALPGAIATIGLCWWNSEVVSWGAGVLILGGVIACSWMTGSILTRRLEFWLGTVTNLLSGLREGDYSFRARTVHPGDNWGDLIAEVNQLADQLRDQRLDACEAASLLRNVMAEIPLGVFTFDPHQRLRLVNAAGESMLGSSHDKLLGRTARDLGLDECLAGAPNRTLDLKFGSTLGRWALRRATVRQEGHPYQLIVLNDLSRTLREEERLAWQRIVRVLGHEVNNSLAPIQSIAASLEKLLSLQERDEDWDRDVLEGLSVIRNRSESLNRFMQAYARVARLPAPTFREVAVSEWVLKTAALETRLAVTVRKGPNVTIRADRDQLDQLLINLIRNATDAALMEAERDESNANREMVKPSVDITWSLEEGCVLIKVSDNGPGVEPSENLFVPFFTTKSGGTGIGLALCRQIAEGHDGALTLGNREEGHGALATLRLPRDQRDH